MIQENEFNHSNSRSAFDTIPLINNSFTNSIDTYASINRCEWNLELEETKQKELIKLTNHPISFISADSFLTNNSSSRLQQNIKQIPSDIEIPVTLKENFLETDMLNGSIASLGDYQSFTEGLRAPSQPIPKTILNKSRCPHKNCSKVLIKRRSTISLFGRRGRYDRTHYLSSSPIKPEKRKKDGFLKTLRKLPNAIFKKRFPMKRIYCRKMK
ncbi:hypothetical protein SNEBB_008246 [Seison nebaliae]|nr:hypothetical protein SNEBB_008246 [Seison nebaliae]